MKPIFRYKRQLGSLLIEDAKIDSKNKSIINQTISGLKDLYCDENSRTKILECLEKYLSVDKKNTGRTGMSYWEIFVLAVIRVSTNTDYSTLHYQVNNDHLLRQIMGIQNSYDLKKIEYDYTTVYKNISRLPNELILELNELIVNHGHSKFIKKKFRK